MFRIDRSSVDYIDSNREIVVIRQWREADGHRPAAASSTPESKQPPQGADPQQALRQEREQSARILQEARGEAERVLQAARQQADRVLQEARDRGYAEGLARAEAQIKQMREVFGGTVEALRQARDHLEQEMERGILELALDVAEKILNIELDRNDSIYVALARRAVMRLRSKNQLKLRVSHQDYERYFSPEGNWLLDPEGLPVEVIGDPQVEPGGCIAESEDEFVDAGVGTQLRAITRELRAAEWKTV